MMDNLVNTYEDEWAAVVKGQFVVAAISTNVSLTGAS